MNKLLQEQLQRYFERGSPDDSPIHLRSFIDAVNEAYEQADSKRQHDARCLEKLERSFMQLGANFEENIAKLITCCGEITQATFVLYHRIMGERLVTVAQWPVPDTSVRLNEPEGHFCYSVIKRGDSSAPYVVKDLGKTPYVNLDFRVEKNGLETYVGYTVSCLNQAVGALCIAYRGKAHITEEDGRLLQIIISTIGVEEQRKRLEEVLAQRAADLARSNTELERFAYIASHDLQEPLRMVASYVQLLARRYRDRLDMESNEFIAYAISGVTRMQLLINDLLAYSRVGTRGQPFQPVDCEAALSQGLANLKLAMQEAGAEVAREGRLPTVMGDSSQLVQVFQNLIGNAIKFRGEEPPRVKVWAVRKEQDWLFAVKDNGIGIEPKYYEHIFIIFKRLHPSKQYPGTGIGLAICKKVIERHGGKIWVESALGKGSTFFFTLP
ncbi:MAG: ATP-binding protein, partial [Nitrososphaera sp.]|nr:ATP-binding protein [Nitrososphaera sp.]